MALFIGLLAVLLAAGTVAIAAGERLQHTDCPPIDDPCGSPPTLPPPLERSDLTRWRSSALGFRLDYDTAYWDKTAEDSRSLTLKLKKAYGADLAVVIGGVKSGESSPDALRDQRLDALKEDVLSLTEDGEASHGIFGQGVGYRDGVGGPYRGNADTPQGPGDPVWAAVMAATDGEITASVSVVTTVANEDERTGQTRFGYYGLVDSVMNTFTWPSES